jgi:hypothetical protein
MDISPIGSQPVLPATSGTPRARPAATNPAPAPTAGGPAMQTVTFEMPDLMPGHLQLDIDRASGRIVGRIVNRKTGALISQVPSDEALRLAAAFKQDFRRIFRRKV